MTTRFTRSTAVLGVFFTVGAAALTGCGSQQAPAAPIPTTADTRAADFAEAKKAVQGAHADFNEHHRYTDQRWMYPELIEKENSVLEEWKRQGLTVKGTSKLISMKEATYDRATASLSIDTCSEVTGGIFDKEGNNVETDPAGKPVDATKARRVAEHVSLGKAKGESWRIASIERMSGAC